MGRLGSSWKVWGWKGSGLIHGERTQLSLSLTRSRGVGVFQGGLQYPCLNTNNNIHYILPTSSHSRGVQWWSQLRMQVSWWQHIKFFPSPKEDEGFEDNQENTFIASLLFLMCSPPKKCLEIFKFSYERKKRDKKEDVVFMKCYFVWPASSQLPYSSIYTRLDGNLF